MGVELARLHTSVYQKLLKERAEATLREKVATLCAQPSFASMDHRELQKLSYSFHTTTRPARNPHPPPHPNPNPNPNPKP